MYTDKLTQAVADAALKVMQEELKGKQKVLDKNKNNKIDAEDLKILRKEESEQLNELTKDTLNKYKDAANQDKAQADIDRKSGDFSQKVAGVYRSNKRQSGITSAWKRLHKEESENLEEGWDDMMKAAKERAKPQPNGGAGKKQGTAYGGSKQKDVKEEAEQLDELNKSTLGSYVKKASHDVAAKGAATRQFANDSEAARKGEDYSEARKKMQMADKTFAKSWKRREGMAKAVDRLTKEEVDQVQERTLTEPEMKKREEVVKSMKKNVQSFKDRYGDRAKEVMYATATNVAKKD